MKKDRVTAVENLIINHARMGLLRQQVDEPTLIKLLSSLPDKGSTVGKVTVRALALEFGYLLF